MVKGMKYSTDRSKPNRSRLHHAK